MSQALLIYDGECAYCRSFVRAIHRLDRSKIFRTLPFDVPEALALLRAQFGPRHGFAMFVFENERVSWGSGAAKRVAELLRLPGWMAQLAFYTYPSLVQLISKLTQRRRAVCGPECVNSTEDKKSSTNLPLKTEAQEELQHLLGGRVKTALPE